MKLEEEIAIVRFGQGACPKEELLARFRQLDEGQKTNLLLEVEILLHPLKPTEAEIASLGATSESTDFPFIVMRFRGVKKTLRINMAEGAIDQSYGLLLDLFKSAYQRCFALEKENPSNWWYRDLSNSETVQQILIQHRELLDEVYANPGFRSEFASLAKLQNQRYSSRKANIEEPVPAVQTHFGFVTYDEMLTGYLENTNYKNSHAIWLLSEGLVKALSKQYKLNTTQARRLLWEVVERHLQETYNTGLD